MQRLYLAGPNFTEADQAWLRRLKQEIEAIDVDGRQPFEVLWPFETIAARIEADPAADVVAVVLEVCTEQLAQADLLVAVLDGSQVDDGTAWEVGYFFCRHRDPTRIVGLRTDFRNGGDVPGGKVNSLIQVCCGEIAGSGAALVSLLAGRA